MSKNMCEVCSIEVYELNGWKVHLPDKVTSEWQWRTSDSCGRTCYVAQFLEWQLTKTGELKHTAQLSWAGCSTCWKNFFPSSPDGLSLFQEALWVLAFSRKLRFLRGFRQFSWSLSLYCVLHGLGIFWETRFFWEYPSALPTASIL